MIEIRDRKTGRKNKTTKLMEKILYSEIEKDLVWYDVTRNRLLVGTIYQASRIQYIDTYVYGQSEIIYIGEL